MSAQTPERSLELENDPYSEEDPYQVLGVARDADRAKIKAAYRNLQKRARRGDDVWTKAQVANESLTKPKKRLLVDLFVLSELRLYDEIVRRYGEVSFEAVPRDLAPLLLRVSDLEWGSMTDDFSVPDLPRIVFSRLSPRPLETDEEIVTLGALPA